MVDANIFKMVEDQWIQINELGVITTILFDKYNDLDGVSYISSGSFKNPISAHQKGGSIGFRFGYPSAGDYVAFGTVLTGEDLNGKSHEYVTNIIKNKGETLPVGFFNRAYRVGDLYAKGTPVSSGSATHSITFHLFNGTFSVWIAPSGSAYELNVFRPSNISPFYQKTTAVDRWSGSLGLPFSTRKIYTNDYSLFVSYTVTR